MTDPRDGGHAQDGTPRLIATEAFLEAAPDAIVIVGSDGRIRTVNGLTEDLFGYAREELIGQKIEMLVPSRFREIHASQRAEYGREPRTRRMGGGQELLGRRKDGSEFSVEISLSPLRTEGETLVISIVRDVTRLKQAEAKFRGLLESAPDAIIVIDAAGLITIVNSQTDRMFGYRRDELLGRPIEVLVPDQGRGGHAAQRARYMASPKTRPMGAGLPLAGRRKDGSTFPVEISLSPLETEQGLLVMSIVRDISDRVRADEERRALESERIRAQEVSRAKDQFLMTLSHELRTPLTATLGWAEILSADETLPQSALEAIRAIRNSAGSQARIIEDVIEVSRLISGKLLLNLALVDPVETIQAAVQTVRPGADAKRIRIQLEFGPDIGMITADRDRLQQIAWNLLANALKFSKKGGVITVAAEQRNSTLELRVTDTGSGIEPSFLPYVFEPFLQADGSTTRATRVSDWGCPSSGNSSSFTEERSLRRATGQARAPHFVCSFPYGPSDRRRSIRRRPSRPDSTTAPTFPVSPCCASMTIELHARLCAPSSSEAAPV